MTGFRKSLSLVDPRRKRKTLKGQGPEVHCAPGLEINNRGGRHELSSASVSLLLEQTILDHKRMNRLINQVIVRAGGIHNRGGVNDTRLNLDHLSRHRMALGGFGRLRLRLRLRGPDVGRRSRLERERLTELIS